MPRIKDNARRVLVEERQSQILSAAAKVFAQKGYERSTIADIAKEAGVAEGSIYNYFKNKGDLLVSLPRQLIQPTVEEVSADLFQDGDGEPPSIEVMLRRVANMFVTTMRKNGHLFRILLSAMPSLKPAMREKYLNQVVQYVISILEAYFQEQIDKGVLRSELNPHVLAFSFIGGFFPYVILENILEIEPAGHFDYEQVIETNIKIFLNGALAESRSQAK